MELNFIPLEKQHYNSLAPYFSLRPTECCESQMAYHAIWENYYNTQFCLLPKGLIWHQKVGTYEHAALPPLCKKEDLAEHFQLLQDHFTNTLKTKLVMFLVDEEALSYLAPDPDKYEVIADVDSFDYIYDADKLRNLSGKNYHKKKNHVNGFLKEYANRYTYKNLTKENTVELLDFSARWMLAKESDDALNRLENEEIGLRTLLDSSDLCDIRIGGIYIDNQLEAFTIGNYNSSQKMAVIHMEKANYQFRGLYPFINQQFLIHGFPEAEVVNREDDMGIASLRKAKETYHPIKMGKKYTIYER